MPDGASPRRWLTFFGHASLLDSDGQQPLPLKYRNGVLLLGFLAAHPGRVFRREMLADLLWPGLATSDGRRNLRVVLSDLVAALKVVGLADLLESQRDWLSLRGGAGLWTDDSLLAALNAGDAQALPWISPLGDLLAANPPWLDVGEARTAEDFQEWLAVQRVHLENLHRQLLAGAPATRPIPASGELARHCGLASLALLRLDVVAKQACADEREAWRRMRARETELARVASLHGGILVDFSLDGCTLAFGHDALHGGYRWLALRAAASLHAVFAADYRVGMGLTAGRVLIERGKNLRASGHRLRLLEQIAAGAEAGEILVDDSYADLASAFGGSSRGLRRFRGVEREVEVYGQEIGKLPAFLMLPISDCAPPFCGRGEVVAELEACWQLATRGMVQRYCLEGEPGIGKTRIAYEFASRLQHQGMTVFWLGGRSETAGNPWSALHELFARLLSATTSNQDWAECLARFLAHTGKKLGPAQQASLLGFLHTHGVVHGERSAFTEAVHGLMCTAGRPSLVVIDDAQWLDAASSTVLRQISAMPSATFFLLTRRPKHTEGLLASHCHIHRLAPLADAAARTILEALPDTDLLDAPAQRRIISAARGLPIYLLAATPHKGGCFAEYLQGMINGLGEAIQVMKVAALFGMQFQLADLLHLVAGGTAEPALERAAASCLIVPRGADSWAFFHPLLHSHLHDLLDLPERRELAPRAARVLVARGELPQAAALFEEGGEAELALGAYCRAARSALAQEDALAACQLFGHVARLGYGEGSAGQWARMYHARALIIKDGYGSNSVQRISRAVRQGLRSFSHGDELAFKATAYAYLGAGGEGAENGLAYAAEMHRLAQTPIQHQTAVWSRANTLFWLGRFAEARPLFDEALVVGADLHFDERVRYFPSDPLVLGHSQMAWMLWFMGENDSAQAHSEAAQAYARASRLRQDQAIACCFSAALCWSKGDIPGLAGNAGEAWAIADGEEYILWKTIARLLLDIARADEGEAPSLLSLLAAEESLRQAYPGGLNTGRWLAATALLGAGHNFIALQVIDKALSEAGRQEHQYCLMDLWRLKALALERLPLRRAVQARAAHARAIHHARLAAAEGWLRRWYPASAARAGDAPLTHREYIKPSLVGG